MRKKKCPKRGPGDPEADETFKDDSAENMEFNQDKKCINIVIKVKVIQLKANFDSHQPFLNVPYSTQKWFSLLAIPFKIQQFEICIAEKKILKGILRKK